MTDDNLRVIWLQICFAGQERQISTSTSQEEGNRRGRNKPGFCPRVDQSSGSASPGRTHLGSGRPAVIRPVNRLRLSESRAQLYLYLKCLLQLLQLVGGEDGSVPPLLLLLLPEHARHISAQARLVQLPCKSVE